MNYVGLVGGKKDMQKLIKTLDNQTIYVNIVQQRIPTKDNPFAFPWLDVIYDLDSPAARVNEISVQEKQQVLLEIADAKGGIRLFPISGRQFLELWHPDWFFGEDVTFTVNDVGLLYASLLSLIWKLEE